MKTSELSQKAVEVLGGLFEAEAIDSACKALHKLTHESISDKTEVKNSEHTLIWIALFSKDLAPYTESAVKNWVQNCTATNCKLSCEDGKLYQLPIPKRRSLFITPPN